MHVTYKVHQVTERDGTSERTLVLSLAQPVDVGVGLDDSPESDDAWERANDYMDPEDAVHFKASAHPTVGLNGGLELATTNPDIKPGMFLRFNVEVLTAEQVRKAAGV